jgi:hypothetical protein
MARDIPGYVVPPPEKRGLQEPEAAAYVGVGLTLFPEIVADGRLPHLKCITRWVLWDHRKLDLYFDQLPDGGDNDREAENAPYAEFSA